MASEIILWIHVSKGMPRVGETVLVDRRGERVVIATVEDGLFLDWQKKIIYSVKYWAELPLGFSRGW